MSAAVDALRRAIYYLDRELAPGQKVRAFSRAIDVVADLDPGELEQRVAAIAGEIRKRAAANPEIIATSAVRGDGIAELRAVLASLATVVPLG